jgi:hypothetical protein
MRYLVKDIFVSGLITFTLLLAPLQSALAVEKLSAIELASHCKHLKSAPEGADAIFCIRYIQGFIDGAIATDERVTMNVADEYGMEESFSERAIRMRVGQRLTLYGSSYYAEFCLGEPVALAEVVDRVEASLRQNPPSSQSMLARDIVYTTLRKHYPCKQDG